MAIQSTPSSPVPERRGAQAYPPLRPLAPPPAMQVVTLAIPLDVNDAVETQPRRVAPTATKPVPRRDSLKRREALLRGKEGTRRRQRWENDHLIHNPHAVPPSKADWEPRPLHPKRTVPYQYASLWDHPDLQRRRNMASQKLDVSDKVPKDLKVRLKKAHGALGLLEALEREVRSFVMGAEATGTINNEDEDKDFNDVDSVDFGSEDSEEEIVFISKKLKKIELPVVEKVLLESRVEDPSASFGRWLVHSIASYYGLRSWSITSGNPAMRYAYVAKKPGPSMDIPKPLYMML
ncbi:R3H-associated N-terminal domain-containing protein [Geopyxis carbonaria]|nr:R3H-associated N-terminal domain-containing protein [Geopyxis carbonaria]